MAKQPVNKNVFNTMLNIDLSDKVENKLARQERKEELSYVPWADAWSAACGVFDDISYEIEMFDQDGRKVPYVYDPNTGYMVFTSVTIEGVTRKMWLPVMDGANKAMKAEAYTYSTKYADKTVEAATMFDINKTIMRCLVKNLAMFGLGINIYAGEDSPEYQPEPKETKQKTAKGLPLSEGDENWPNVVKYVNANKGGMSIEDIVKQLSRKYSITPAVQAALAKFMANA